MNALRSPDYFAFACDLVTEHAALITGPRAGALVDSAEEQLASIARDIEHARTEPDPTTRAHLREQAERSASQLVGIAQELRKAIREEAK